MNSYKHPLCSAQHFECIVLRQLTRTHYLAILEGGGDPTMLWHNEERTLSMRWSMFPQMTTLCLWGRPASHEFTSRNSGAEPLLVISPQCNKMSPFGISNWACLQWVSLTTTTRTIPLWTLRCLSLQGGQGKQEQKCKRTALASIQQLHHARVVPH